MSARTEYASNRMRQHRSIIRGRVRLGFFLISLLFVLLAGRLAYIQVLQHSYWGLNARKVRLHRIVLLGQRGVIVDRNGVPLAINVSVGDIAADPLVINDPIAFAFDLAKYVPNLDAAAVAARIAAAKQEHTSAGRKLRFLLLAKGVAYEHIQALQTQFDAEKKAHIKDAKNPVNLTGYSVTTRWVRSYPKGTLACQILGFLGLKNNVEIGEYGIEKSMNSVLTGSDGYVVRETDAQGREIPGTEIDRKDSLNGGDVQLTIDVNIQRYAEAALAKSVTAHHAQAGTCIVMDPKTGEVLALANMPQFNPNNLNGSNYSEWDDRAVSDLYEPGSTLKPVTLSAVLDAQGLQEQYHHVYCSGEMRVGNHTIHCAKDPPTYGVHGDEDMRDVLKNSCNIGAAQFAMHLGADKLFAYENAFGFLDKLDVGLPGAVCSRLKSPDIKPWSQIELANVAFGQGISVTPLALATAYSALANNGVRVYPHIIKGMTEPNAAVQIVKPEVARTMLSMLQTVVLDGTGKPAQIAGYNIGGKTGSAQVAENGHYGDQYIGSFCGIAPLTDPKMVILCVVDRPVGVHWGAVVAAPVVHDVAQQALWYMSVLRDAPDKVDYADRPKTPHRAHSPDFGPTIPHKKTHLHEAV